MNLKMKTKRYTLTVQKHAMLPELAAIKLTPTFDSRNPGRSVLVLVKLSEIEKGKPTIFLDVEL